MRDLTTFFGAALPKRIIREVIETARKAFSERTDVSRESNHLQFLRKCEHGLMKLVKKESGLEE